MPFEAGKVGEEPHIHSLNGQIFIQVRDHSGGEKERAPRIFLTLYCGEGQPLRYVS
jgi:hypothetical protein